MQVSDVTNVLKVANEMDPRVSDLTSAGSSHVHRSLTVGCEDASFFICVFVCVPMFLGRSYEFATMCAEWNQGFTGTPMPFLKSIHDSLLSSAGGKLWHRLASNELPSLQPIWPRISKWLLQAPEGTPPVVFMTMLWLPFVRCSFRSFYMLMLLVSGG